MKWCIFGDLLDPLMQITSVHAVSYLLYELKMSWWYGNKLEKTAECCRLYMLM